MVYLRNIGCPFTGLAAVAVSWYIFFNRFSMLLSLMKATMIVVIVENCLIVGLSTIQQSNLFSTSCNPKRLWRHKLVKLIETIYCHASTCIWTWARVSANLWLRNGQFPINFYAHLCTRSRVRTSWGASHGPVYFCRVLIADCELHCINDFSLGISSKIRVCR